MMAEQMGWNDIDEEDVPIDFSELSYDAALTLKLFNVLPDRIDGMSGTWLGKDYGGIGDIMNIYQIPKSALILDLLQVCIDETIKINEQKRKK